MTRLFLLMIGFAIGCGADTKNTECLTACKTACAADEVCVAPAVGDTFSATCLKTCVDERDCTAPFHCATVANAAGTSNPPAVCVSDDAPRGCGTPGTGFCSELTAHPGSTTCDGAILLVAEGATPNNVCLRKRQSCPTGQTCHVAPNDLGSVIATNRGMCE